MKIFHLVLLLALPFLAACKEDDADLTVPAAVALNEEAAGFYCQMVILDHPGPKAQIHLAGYPQPLWFSQVHDGIAYLKSPEQTAEVLVLYVNDMGAAPSWEKPGETNWINAKTAFFVVGSTARGGMGAPEIVPFADRNAALTFAKQLGGEVLDLKSIPIEAVLAPVDTQSPEPEGTI